MKPESAHLALSLRWELPPVILVFSCWGFTPWVGGRGPGLESRGQQGPKGGGRLATDERFTKLPSVARLRTQGLGCCLHPHTPPPVLETGMASPCCMGGR